MSTIMHLPLSTLLQYALCTAPSIFLLLFGSTESFVLPLRPGATAAAANPRIFFEKALPPLRIRNLEETTTSSLDFWHTEKLPELDLDTLMDGSKARDIVERQTDDASHFERKRKMKALKRCGLFRTAHNSDLMDFVDSMESVKVEGGQTVFKQGDEGDSMYFVDDGVFECYGEDDSNKIWKHCSSGDHFGELAIVFDDARAASVRNANATVARLWKLHKDSFFSAVRDMPRFDNAVDNIKAEYDLYSHWERFSKVGPSKLHNKLRLTNLPKKKPVSLHSTASSMAAGMYLMAIASTISLGIDTISGTYHVFDFDAFNLKAPETQLVAFLFAYVGVSGMFRLHPKTSKLRKYYFEFTGLQTLFCYFLQDSNIVATTDSTRYTFDLLSINPGSIAASAVFILANIWTCKLISEAISAPPKDRRMVPWNANPLIIASTTVFFGLLLSQMVPGCMYTLDTNAYQDIYVPFANQAPDSWVLSSFLLVQGSMSFNMLFATLLFENKIGQLACGILSVTQFVPQAAQVWDFWFRVTDSPEGAAYAHYNNQVFADLHLYQILLVTYAGAALQGMAKRAERTK